MKHLIIALIAVFVSSSASAELILEFQRNSDGSRTIIHNPQDWSFAAKTTEYSVFVDKTVVGTKQKNLEFHAVTVFNTPQEYSLFPYKINRIYSYGVLSCEEAKLYLLADFFTDSDNTIRYNQSHDFGAYVTNLNVPKSISKEIYDVVCGDTI